MFIVREIVGGIVSLIFYIGIVSIVYSLATGVSPEGIQHAGMGNHASVAYLAVSDDTLYCYEQ